MIQLRKSFESEFDHLRKRMIRETEIALAIGMRFPDRAIRIPTMEVGHGSFHPAFVDRFWSEVLEEQVNQEPGD